MRKRILIDFDVVTKASEKYGRKNQRAVDKKWA